MRKWSISRNNLYVVELPLYNQCLIFKQSSNLIKQTLLYIPPPYLCIFCCFCLIFINSAWITLSSAPIASAFFRWADVWSYSFHPNCSWVLPYNGLGIWWVHFKDLQLTELLPDNMTSSLLKHQYSIHSIDPNVIKWGPSVHAISNNSRYSKED